MDSIRKYEENQEEYEKLDKRTKGYKEWKAKRDAAPQGLGDSIEKVTEATGIKAAVKFVAGEDCGCDERRKKLNKLLPFRNPECLSEDEYIWLSELFESERSMITRSNQHQLMSIYNRVFHKNQRVTSCVSCVRRVYRELKQYFDSYA